MTLSVLSIAQISAVIVGLVIVIIFRMINARAPTYPPIVGGPFPWVSAVLVLALGPSNFFAACQARYGPVFKVLVGGRDFIVVSSPDALASAAAADHRVLSSHVQHDRHLQALYGDSPLQAKTHDTLVHKIFPVLDRRLSKRTLGDLAPPFAQLVFDKLKLLSGKPQVSLMRSLTEPLYVGANGMLFGSRFPQDTYEDFRILLNSLPKRLSKFPSWSIPFNRARDRLLQRISDYLEGANPAADDKLVATFTPLFKEHNIPIEVTVSSILSLMSSLHQNTFNVVFWLFSWLLEDPTALASVRSEIDKVIREDFGNLQTFIVEANPDEVDSPSFALLNSAVLETMRLASVQTGVRIATCDLDIKDREKIIPISKGEYVVLDPRGAHLDESLYPNCEKFVVDRFVESEYRGDFATTAGYPFFTLGAGKHVCKGRFLALYEIKVVTIVYLSLFDVTPITRGKGPSSTWEPPKHSSHSIGTIHPTEDVLVRLRPRSVP
ncbi:cytochrome P450 [Pisolithus croceorrhizus]|nr:cytochrome P450 [Pisolithus croceorrhizus]KAI6169066.1 cytochrome P450 [Pisolithus thermaeus]